MSKTQKLHWKDYFGVSVAIEGVHDAFGVLDPDTVGAGVGDFEAVAVGVGTGVGVDRDDVVLRSLESGIS